MNNKLSAKAPNIRWLGIALIILGTLAIVTPAIAGSAVVIVIGIIMLAAGIPQIYRGLRSAAWSEKILTTTLGILSIGAGLLVLGHPILGLAFLSLLLAIYFFAEGIAKIVAAIQYRPMNGWLWLLVSGVLSGVLGALIWNQWPVSGLWAVGVLVGVNLLSTGSALLMLSATVERIVRS